MTINSLSKIKKKKKITTKMNPPFEIYTTNNAPFECHTQQSFLQYKPICYPCNKYTP